MRSRSGYQKLPQEDRNDSESDNEVKVSRKKKIRERVQNFIPEQFRKLERPIPWKSICYATFLFVVGTILLLIGCLIHTGHVEQHFGHEVIILHLLPSAIK